MGGAVSTFVIWAATAVFSRNVPVKQWSEPLQRNIYASDSPFRERTEGWATSHVGRYGIIAARSEDFEAPSSVIIWGDSFVQGLHVDDNHKMQRQLTEILKATGEPAIAALAVGEHFASLPDYCFRIPDYEAMLKDVRLHIVHMFSLDDTYPDLYEGRRRSQFYSHPQFRIEKFDNEFGEIEAPFYATPTQSLVSELDLEFFDRLRGNLAGIARLQGMRFAPGIYRGVQPGPGAHRAWNRYLKADWNVDDPPIAAWSFLLDELDAATDVPILIVYAPPTPALKNGHMIFLNPEGPLADEFGKLCLSKGFGYVNLESAFRSFFEETGRLHKGFANSRPWEGHYNEDGHRIVAEAIANWIKQNRHVVYPD